MMLCEACEEVDFYDSDSPYYCKSCKGTNLTHCLPCPDCCCDDDDEYSGVLIKRINSTSGQEFWGCSNYPDCTYTEN